MGIGSFVKKALQIGKIQHACVEPPQQGTGIVHIEVHVCIRVLSQIGVHHSGQHKLPDGLGGSHPHHLTARRRRHPAFRPADHPTDLPHLAAKLLSLLRQIQPLAAVLEKVCSVMALQVLDMLGNRRLGKAQILRCPGIVESLAQIQKRIIAKIQHPAPLLPARPGHF